MHILILGAAGMIGRRLTKRLIAEGKLGETPIDKITTFDVFPSQIHSDEIRIEDIAGDVADRSTIESLILDRPDVIIHLAAVVSGEAEADFDKGYHVNLDGTRQLFEMIRAQEDYHPRVVFTSSIAVYGAPFSGAISDEFLLAPMSSYGTQKAICELLLNDYSRRGIFDGIGIRLPTIVVRPGKPNKAASSFFSGIIREPLAGLEAVLPVDDSVKSWLASPDAAAGFLIHAATLDTAPLGARRCLNMPGVAVTVAGMIEALREVAGDAPVARIRREPDPAVRAIVDNWPEEFDPARALALGFTADPDFASIIRAHLRDQQK
ncbi:D-erythronate dehydrogenase [Paracoccus aminophilus]|uniref:NAD-dependent epimerase/dehydratase n=1 Tax=Paracoccus aminophilus JCM 7686 TaxID=1367847 RepID=S5XYG2_PARAH|nr:D-erythronate dehydrogenase [Paracoccus aminophilus]AGT10352.1 NAD-dependent epimerase/dehydratase [Paracoccus aminophilus JCM 7686]